LSFTRPKLGAGFLDLPGPLKKKELIIMKQLAELEITDNKKLILSIGEYKGDERIDLRQYVKVDEEYIPTKKGINFSAEWIDKFMAMIEKLKNI